MAFCKQVKALGYKVFSQLVSVTSYTDDELREVIGLVNDCHPYAVSMVDTYGLCDAPTLAHIVSVIDKELALILRWATMHTITSSWHTPMLFLC